MLFLGELDPHKNCARYNFEESHMQKSVLEVQKKIRKVLDQKIQQLNDITADIDMLLTEMETEHYRVTIFGSARMQPENAAYKQVYDLAFALASRGIDIVTGGGPGLMEAANKGAKDGCNHSRSIGLPIDLPFEKGANKHLDVKRAHRRFSGRLDEFIRISHAVVVTAGGLGTCLEFFYTWQLLQVGHIQPRPVILLGKEIWGGLIKWLEGQPLKKQLMSKKDLDMLRIVDSVDEVIEILTPDFTSFRDKIASRWSDSE